MNDIATATSNLFWVTQFVLGKEKRRKKSPDSLLQKKSCISLGRHTSFNKENLISVGFSVIKKKEKKEKATKGLRGGKCAHGGTLVDICV